jgi:hypothetical protein
VYDVVLKTTQTKPKSKCIDNIQCKTALLGKIEMGFTVRVLLRVEWRSDMTKLVKLSKSVSIYTTNWSQMQT